MHFKKIILLSGEVSMFEQIRFQCEIVEIQNVAYSLVCNVMVFVSNLSLTNFSTISDDNNHNVFTNKETRIARARRRHLATCLSWGLWTFTYVFISFLPFILGSHQSFWSRMAIVANIFSVTFLYRQPLLYLPFVLILLLALFFISQQFLSHSLFSFWWKEGGD